MQFFHFFQWGRLGGDLNPANHLWSKEYVFYPLFWKTDQPEAMLWKTNQLQES